MDLLAHLPKKVAPRNIDNLARFLFKKEMRIGQGQALTNPCRA